MDCLRISLQILYYLQLLYYILVEYNFDERHSWIREDFRLRIMNLEKVIKNKDEVSNLIRYSDFSSVEDDDGFYFASSLIKIPIISAPI